MVEVQCLQRWQKVLKPGLVKGQWTVDEDAALTTLVSQGFADWGKLALKMPGRTSKQCRERWCHHLDPTVLKSDFSREEDDRLILFHQSFGNRWSMIARLLPGRTENSVRSRVKFMNRGSIPVVNATFEGPETNKRSKVVIKFNFSQIILILRPIDQSAT